MKNKELITVYITNYNYGKYIDKCIESVLLQTYKYIEILIIDDGSKDNSKKIIQKYAKNKKIKIVFQKNKGLITTNNIAVKLSNGKYIMRVDADDWLEKNAVEILYKEIKKDPKIAMVFSNYYEVNDYGKIITEYRRHNFKKIKILDKPAHGACSLIDKSKILLVGGYNENLTCQDGYDIWFKFINKFKVKHISKSLFYYRQHEKSLSKDQSKILLNRSKILNSVSKKNKNFHTLGVMAIRGPISDLYSNVFTKINKVNLIDYTLKEILNSEINKIIIATPDENLKKYIKSNFKTKKIIFLKRNISSALFNTSIDEIILKCFSKFRHKNKKKYDAIMNIAIEAPFRKSFYFDSMISVMKIFKTDSVIAVKNESDNFFKHTESGLKIINDDKKLKLERNEIFRQVGKFYLISKKLLSKGICLPKGNIGHIVLDDVASLSLEEYKFMTKFKKI